MFLKVCVERELSSYPTTAAPILGPTGCNCQFIGRSPIALPFGCPSRTRPDGPSQVADGGCSGCGVHGHVQPGRPRVQRACHVQTVPKVGRSELGVVDCGTVVHALCAPLAAERSVHHRLPRCLVESRCSPTSLANAVSAISIAYGTFLPSPRTAQNCTCITI